MTADFTLANPKIKAFFEGRSMHKPVAEFMYVHTHPMTKNFMSEIEVLINIAAIHLQTNSKGPNVSKRLFSLAEQYASCISDVTEETAAKMLDVLKQIYDVCMACQTFAAPTKAPPPSEE